jgi:hypothetical protein
VTAKGHNGQVTFENGWITIERKSLGRFGHSKGDKRIRVDQIIGVKMRPAGRLANGFIAFEVSGRPFNGGLSEAQKDDNAVIFTRKHQDEFAALRMAVEEAAGAP